MTVQKRPDENIFASSAKSGELETFPDIPRGWGVSFDQTEGKPPMEWFNYLFKRQDEAIKYMLQQGLPEWSPTEDYPVHALTRVGAKVYRAITANINKSPATNAVIWKEWGLDADLVLLKENNLSEIKEKGEEAQKAARDNIGAIAASDIPKVDLTGYVPITRKINNKALSADVSLTATDVGAAPASHAHTTAQITGLDTALAGKAPTSHSHTTAQITGLDTALAGKAPTSHAHSDLSKIDASNINVANYLAKLGLNEASLNTNGWQKFPNGLIFQWGFREAGAGKSEIILYPIKFPKKSLVVYGTDSNTANSTVAANLIDNTSFKLDQTTDSSASWFAIGY